MPARSILAWLAIGLVVGIIGTLAAPARDRSGLIASILIGITGALIAGFVAQTMRWTTSGTWQDVAAAALGAVAALATYRLVGQRRA